MLAENSLARENPRYPLNTRYNHHDVDVWSMMMATAKLFPSYERFLDRVVESMTPEEILAFKEPEEEQRRVEDFSGYNESAKQGVRSL